MLKWTSVVFPIALINSPKHGGDRAQTVIESILRCGSRIWGVLDGGCKRSLVDGVQSWREMPWLLLVIVLVLTSPAARLAAEEPAAPSLVDIGHARAPIGDAPTVVEWLNQTLRVRDTVRALDRPSSEAKSSARIRSGAEVKAIGIIGGGEWVQIELPDRALAYLPSTAVELNDKSAGSARGPDAAKAAASEGAVPEPKPPAPVIRGSVTKVPNAATLVVADRRIRLSGVDPGPFAVLGAFENWLHGQGALLCEPDAQTGRYRCFTSNGVDVAEAALLNGAGRVGDGATPSYRERESEARQARRGLWHGP
jgi:endonuclease YncB( thermonuclease family)